MPDRQDPVQRAPPLARRQRVLLLAVRRGGDPDRRRRRRVGDARRSGRGATAHDARDRCDEIRFPHSLGLLYSAFTAFLGFEVNEGEYKVMGMAPYGEPRYVDKVEKLSTIERRRQLLARHELLLRSTTRRRGPTTRSSSSCSASRATRTALLHRARATRLLRREAADSTHRRAQPVLRRHRRQHPVVHRGDRPGMARDAARETGLDRTSAWPAAWRSTASPTAASSRDAVRGALRPAGGRRRRRRARRGAVRLARACSASRAGSCMEHAYWGPSTHRRRDRATTCASAGIAYTRCSTTRTQLLDRVVERARAGARSSAGSRAASSGARARSATAASSPTPAAPT